MNENHRIALVKDFRFIIGFIALCSFVGFFEFLIPLLDLFNHFRIQAVVGSIVCAIISFYLRDRRTSIFGIAVLILNLGIVGYKLDQSSGSPALHNEKPSFSVISSNVLTSNTDYDAVIEMAENENSDLVVFSEVDDIWLKKLDRLSEKYHYAFRYPRPDNFGLAAYSKKPFKGEIKISGEARLPILILQFDDVTVIASHPLPPATNRNMIENRAYLSDIAALAKTDKSIVVAGDLNSTLWSAAFKPLFDSGFSRINPWGIAYTWPKNNPLFALQIDHFLGKNIKAADFKVLPSVGSDHFPIRADILLSSE